jgi:hypothetical protein
VNYRIPEFQRGIIMITRDWRILAAIVVFIENHDESVKGIRYRGKCRNQRGSQGRRSGRGRGRVRIVSVNGAGTRVNSGNR